jgi:HSP20 family protein
MVAAIFMKGKAMANLTRYTPFEDLFNELTQGYMVKPLSAHGHGELRMKLDVKEDDSSFNVRAEIPGVKKEDISVDVNGNQVSLRAEVKQEKEEKKGEKVIYSERSYGMVSRSFGLPADVDAQGAKAEYKDGVLCLSLPKKTSAQSKRLTVA